MSTRLDKKIIALKALLADIETNHAQAAFASSFGAEDMVLLDLIANEFKNISVFTLDTGRLPNETLDLMHRAQAKYKLEVAIYKPQASAVQNYITNVGLNGFYESIENRKSCCHIRKVEPLARALAGKGAWLTGLRREQAPTRADLSESEFDAAHNIIKFNPLIDWTNDDVWAYIKANDVPYNALHDRGYPSIGCEPCTRSVKPKEDPRAGRWWWESKTDQKECGLHVADLSTPSGESLANQSSAASTIPTIPKYASVAINVIKKVSL